MEAPDTRSFARGRQGPPPAHPLGATAPVWGATVDRGLCCSRPFNGSRARVPRGHTFRGSHRRAVAANRPICHLRLSTAPFRNRLYEPRNVAELLGVRYVLSGTMQAAGGACASWRELTEADLGRVIWAERFEGSLADVFELEDRLSHDIAERVVPFVCQRELRRARTEAPGESHRLRADAASDRRYPPELARGSRACPRDAGSGDRLRSAIRGPSRMVEPLYFIRRWSSGWSADAARRHGGCEPRGRRRRSISMPTNSWVCAVNGLVEAYLNKNLDVAVRSLRSRAGPSTSARSAGMGLEHDGVCVVRTRRGSHQARSACGSSCRRSIPRCIRSRRWQAWRTGLQASTKLRSTIVGGRCGSKSHVQFDAQNLHHRVDAPGQGRRGGGRRRAISLRSSRR